ncbi:hypothetical protein JCM10213v2_007027 [Rhodosporidiobolus nylandii]
MALVAARAFPQDGNVGVAATPTTSSSDAGDTSPDQPSSDDAADDDEDGDDLSPSDLDPSFSNSTDATVDPATAAIDPASSDSTDSIEDPSTAEVDPSTSNSTDSGATADGTEDADQALPTSFDLNAFTADSDFQTDGAGAAQPAATARS